MINRCARVQGENVVRSSGVPFAVVRPTALTEEPAGAELQVDQGDTIKVRANCLYKCPAVLDLVVRNAMAHFRRLPAQSEWLGPATWPACSAEIRL